MKPIIGLLCLLALLGLLARPAKGLPQDSKKLQESYSDDTTALYDDFGMRIWTKAPLEKGPEDPFKPSTGHKPGGLPMISDSAFSLTILIYVSVAFLLVFFLFCWKTNGNNNGENGENELKQQCPLMINSQPDKNLAEPCVIPPTPTSDNNKRVK